MDVTSWWQRGRVQIERHAPILLFTTFFFSVAFCCWWSQEFCRRIICRPHPHIQWENEPRTISKAISFNSFLLFLAPSLSLSSPSSFAHLAGVGLVLLLIFVVFCFINFIKFSRNGNVPHRIAARFSVLIFPLLCNLCVNHGIAYTPHMRTITLNVIKSDGEKMLVISKRKRKMA